MEDEEAYLKFLEERRSRILEIADEALRRSGRADAKVTLAAVSKTVGPDEVAQAWKAGYHVFAENRPRSFAASSKRSTGILRWKASASI